MIYYYYFSFENTENSMFRNKSLPFLSYTLFTQFKYYHGADPTFDCSTSWPSKEKERKISLCSTVLQVSQWEIQHRCVIPIQSFGKFQDNQLLKFDNLKKIHLPINLFNKLKHTFGYLMIGISNTILTTTMTLKVFWLIAILDKYSYRCWNTTFFPN